MPSGHTPTPPPPIHAATKPVAPTISEGILDRLFTESRIHGVLAARSSSEMKLEFALARQLAALPNGEAVLHAMAVEFESRIRYRMPQLRPGYQSGGETLETRLLASCARFFERVRRRRAELLQVDRATGGSGKRA